MCVGGEGGCRVHVLNPVKLKPCYKTLCYEETLDLPIPCYNKSCYKEILDFGSCYKPNRVIINRVIKRS